MRSFFKIVSVALIVGIFWFWPKDNLEVKFVKIPKPDFYEKLTPEQVKFYESLDIPTLKKIYRGPTEAEQRETFDLLWKRHVKEKSKNP